MPKNYLVTYSTDSVRQCDLFHRSKIMCDLVHRFKIILWPFPQTPNHIVTNPTETFFIRLYSTDARLSWDQFQCILMDIVTLSTDTNDCDLRHQCISEFDLHLCTWAQCCSGNGHNFFGTYSTLLYGQFHSYNFLWPIPALTFGVTYSTDASGPNSKLNFVTYSSTPSRPYSVSPLIQLPHFETE